MPKRCTMFHRTFTDRRIKPDIISKVFKWFGITKKKVEDQNVPIRLEERQPEFKQDILMLDDKIHEILEDGGHLVYLDETLFKSKDFMRRAYSNHDMNHKVMN